MQLRASGGAFGELVRVFSLLAIITSTVGFVYGLVRRAALTLALTLTLTLTLTSTLT